MDLAKKAQRWDEKYVSTLKAKKEKLAEELRQAMKNSRKESEIQIIQSHIGNPKINVFSNHHIALKSFFLNLVKWQHI